MHDKTMPLDRVRAAYDVRGATENVFVDLACSSHNAMWERTDLLMFRGVPAMANHLARLARRAPA